MIKRYKLHNFKIHADTDLRLAPLTLLTGINGSGKSSIFQSMLMLRESTLRRDCNTLYIKGHSYDVGDYFEDLIHWDMPDDNRPDILQIDIHTDHASAPYTFAYTYATQSPTTLKAVDGNTCYCADELSEQVSLFGRGFQYLSAYRQGPEPVYRRDTDIVDGANQLSDYRGMGEYTVYYLDRHGHEPLALDALMHPDSDEDTLMGQVERWLGDIAPNIRIKIKQEKGDYYLGYGSQRGSTRISSAINTGFGITYVLSLIVSILSSKPGDLLLFENPEAHIHPAGQAALMRLITTAAGAGIQILIETHSDHIINGALVGLKQGRLTDEDLAIHYLWQDGESNLAHAEAIKINEDCRIYDSPDGFFTQFSDDLDILFS